MFKFIKMRLKNSSLESHICYISVVYNERLMPDKLLYIKQSIKSHDSTILIL